MATLETNVAAVRRFSRFYTKQVGLLSEGLLDSPYSLSEARVIYELAQRDDLSASDVARELDLDAGYVSRILSTLERRGVITKTRSDVDRRRVLLGLSEGGRSAYEELNSGSRRQIAALLGRLDPARQQRVVRAMRRIEIDLGAPEPRRPSVLFRPHRPGDIGWIVQRHGELYHASHGWDETFEAMVARIAAHFVEHYDPTCERSWIAEIDDRRVGAIALVRRSKTIGQLRLLFVEPEARGLGVGARLVSECVSHARYVGYRKMTLYTVRGLDAARRLYEAEGFRLSQETPTHEWGGDQIEQRWDLTL